MFGLGAVIHLLVVSVIVALLFVFSVAAMIAGQPVKKTPRHDGETAATDSTGDRA